MDANLSLCYETALKAYIATLTVVWCME